MTSTVSKIFAVILVLALSAAAGWTLYLAREAPSEALNLQNITLLDTPRPLPEFSLLEQHGQSVDDKHFQGRWTIFFFGFTHCPAICPNTLALLDTIVTDQRLASQTVHVALISVDPERDTPKRLHSYLRNFNPDFLGLTGDPAALKRLRKALYVPLQRIETEEGYTLDHGSTLILINPNAEVAGFMTSPHQRDPIITDLQKLLAASN